MLIRSVFIVLCLMYSFGSWAQFDPRAIVEQLFNQLWSSPNRISAIKTLSPRSCCECTPEMREILKVLENRQKIISARIIEPDNNDTTAVKPSLTWLEYAIETFRQMLLVDINTA